MAEFWPQERWPHPPRFIRQPSIWRRLACWLNGGHTWRLSAWGGMYLADHENKTWPFFEYCPVCGKFRDRIPANPGDDHG